jgi:hypothetical protein
MSCLLPLTLVGQMILFETVFALIYRLKPPPIADVVRPLWLTSLQRSNPVVDIGPLLTGAPRGDTIVRVHSLASEATSVVAI